MDNTINSIVSKAAGGVSDQQIKEFLAGNPTPAQLATAMQTYGVSPEQVFNAAGVGQGNTLNVGGTIYQPEYATTGSGMDQQVGGLQNIYSYAADQNKTGGAYNQYDPSGKLIQTGTQQAVDNNMLPFLLAAGGMAFGLPGLGETGGTVAGTTAGGSTLGSLGTVGADYGLGTGGVAGMGGAGGITSGYSGLGINAGTAGLGAEGLGAGITAGSGLTGTGVLTGSGLGTGLLGSSALNNLTGTGVLAGSTLGTSLLGTNAGTGLTGTGILSGSGLGTTLLGTGAGTGVTGGIGGTGTLLGTGGTGTGTLLGGTGTGTGLGTLTGSTLGSLAGGVLGAAGAISAADKQAEAAKYAADLQKKMFDIQNAQQAPYRAGGYNALNQIQGMLPSQYTKYDANGNPIGTATGTDYLTHQFNASDFANNVDPGYAFRLQQGQMANQRLANKAGGLLGANAMQGMQDYTQGAASGEYQNAYNRYTGNQSGIYNRLASLAGIGQTGQTQTNQMAQTAATNQGNLAVGSAGAQAAGLTGATSALGNALGTLGNNYTLAQLLGQNQNIFGG
jgi:hypothetical protein